MGNDNVSQLVRYKTNLKLGSNKADGGWKGEEEGKEGEGSLKDALFSFSSSFLPPPLSCAGVHSCIDPSIRNGKRERLVIRYLHDC